MVLDLLPELFTPWATKANDTVLDPERRAFIDTYGPYARRYGAQTGIAPEVLLAMGASESNWGRAGSIFGIKGPGPSGQSQTYDTWEAGPNNERIPTKAEFATYANPDEAFQHFVGLLSTERYAPAAEYVKQTGDSAGFLRMINDAGYATDRNWANSIVSLANGMGNGQFPDAPPPGQGKVTGIGISFNDKPSGNAFENMARLVVQKRIDSTAARQAVVDEEARARLETDLGRPMPALSHEAAQSPEYQITPPSVGDGGVSRISPPGVDPTVHPGISPPGVDTSVHPEENPAAQQANLASTALQRFKDMGSGPDILGAATGSLAPLEKVRDVAGGLAEKGLIGPPGLSGVATLNSAVSGATGLPNVAGALNRAGAEGAVPTTPLDVGLTIGPGNIAKGLGIAGDAVRGARGAEGVLSIISDADRAANARKMYQTLRAAGRTDEEIASAFGQQAVDLGKGGVATSRAVNAAPQMASQAESQAARTTYERVLKETGDADAATDAARRAAGAEQGAKTTLRTRAEQMSDRMGSGAVEDGRTIAGDVAPRTDAEIADALSAEADRLSTGEPATGSTIGAIATAAKRLGDPASEIRRQLQQGGGGQNSIIERSSETPVTREEAATRQLRMDDFVEGAAKSQAQRVQDALEVVNANQKKGFGSRIASEAAGLFGLPRTYALSADTGVARDMTLMASHPSGLASAATGARVNLQSYLSDDFAKTAQAWVDDHPLMEFLTNKKYFPDGGWRTGPLHNYKHGGGVAADLRVPEMSGLNESRISAAAEKVPLLGQGITRSDRALAVGRNVAGMDWVARRYASLAQEFGVESPRFLSEMRSTVDWANHLRGYSGSKLAKVLGPLNALTSPQQMVSRLQLALDPIVFASRGDYASARYAAENLLGFAVEQGSLLMAMKLAGQNGPARGLWSVNLNPTDTDFGQVKVGNTRFDFLAGLGPLVKLTSRIAAAGSDAALGTDIAPNDQASVEDLLMRWFENKENPSSKILTDRILHHKNPDIETLRNSFVPSLATGMIDASKNGGSPGLTGLVGLAGFTGVGANTYKGNDDVKREAASSLGIDDYNSLDPVQKLPVLARLPEDAQKNVMTPERDNLKASLNKAGYLEAPKDADGKPKGETDSEAKKRLTANADVIATHPDLDVQRWFFGDKGGGTVHSLDAVDQALALKINGRKVQYSGADRDLAASDDDRKAWDKYGNVIDWYENDLVKNTENLDAVAAQKYQGKKFAALKPTEQDAVKGLLKDAARKAPETEAKLIFFGVEKPNKNGEYSASSPAVLEALQALWKEFPDANALPREGTKITVPARK